MPAVLAHAGPADFTEPHLDFVGDDCGQNQILSAQPFALAEGQRRGDQIARMTRVRLPIDVVVIHRADHVAVEKDASTGLVLKPETKLSPCHCRRPSPGNA